jgi:hypothetical protein
MTLGPQTQLQLQLQQQPHIPQPPRAFGHARGALFGKPLNAGAPQFRPNAFSFMFPLNMPTFPLQQPPPALPSLHSPAPATNMDTDLMCAQQGHEKCQRCGSVGSVESSDRFTLPLYHIVIVTF